MRVLRHAGRGALAGATAGAVAGLVDQLLRSLDPSLAASGSAAFAVLVFWIAAWIPVGLILGLVLGFRRRWADALTHATALVAVIGGYANQRWLPALLDPLSLVFDVAILVAAGSVVTLVARAEYRFDPRPRVMVLVLLCALIGTGLASHRTGPASRTPAAGPVAEGPDVLVVLLDALRADHCSAYGYSRETTPNLDRVADQGVLFERAWSVSSWTKPAVATLFSGLYPTRHGNHAINALLPPAVLTLPEVYRAHGYRTAVFAENNFVSPLFGFAQGVDHFEGSDPSVYKQTILGHVLDQLAARATGLDGLLAQARRLDRLDPGQRTFSEDGIDLPQRVVDWVGRVPAERRFFAYVHLLKPHAPYRVPAGFGRRWSEPGGPERPPHVEGIGPFAHAGELDEEERRRLVDNYDERIRFGDHQLGQIVDGVRAAGRDPLLVVLSDHGEEFGENGLYDHGHSLQEGVTRIPLVVSWPGRLAAGTRVTAASRLLDLPASLLDWSGLPVPDSFDGEPHGDPAQLSPRPVFLELEHGPGYAARGLVRDDLKIVETVQGGQEAVEIFDLRKDPAETRSIAVEGEDPLVWMQAEVDALVEHLEGRGTLSAETGIDPATEERLRALGYIR